MYTSSHQKEMYTWCTYTDDNMYKIHHSSLQPVPFLRRGGEGVVQKQSPPKRNEAFAQIRPRKIKEQAQRTITMRLPYPYTSREPPTAGIHTDKKN